MLIGAAANIVSLDPLWREWLAFLEPDGTSPLQDGPRAVAAKQRICVRIRKHV